jgi:hypothetical protein
MGAIENSIAHYQKNNLIPRQENTPFDECQIVDEKASNSFFYFDEVLSVLPPDENNSVNASDLDLGLGLEAASKGKDASEWEFDSHRADL